MAIQTHEYRWQDHVPRLGLLDAAVSTVAASILLAAFAATPPHVAGPERTAVAFARDPCGGSVIGDVGRQVRPDGRNV